MNIELNQDNLKDVYFAGGCFWGVQEYYSRVPGVSDCIAGYANGNIENPTYEQVCSNTTGFAEAVHVRYDPGVISLKTLTTLFFEIIDPVSVNKQGNDRGIQYRSGIFYVTEEDRAILEAMLKELQKKYEKPLATELKPLDSFYPAEAYHQDYLKNNPGGSCHIDFRSLKLLETRADGTVGIRGCSA